MITGKAIRTFLLAIGSLAIVAGLGALGTWQVLWMQWHDQLVEQAAQIPGSEQATLTDIEAGLEYGYDVNMLRVRLSGFYRHDLERYVEKSQNGKAGYQVITPFIEDSGYVVLVDRGWVGETDRLPAARLKPRAPDGKISINGITRANAVSMMWSYPKADLKNNIWYWYDRIGIARTFPEGIGEIDGQSAILAALFVQVEPGGESGDGQLPIIAPLKVASPFNHALAAAISYLLALGVAIVTIRMFWRHRKKTESEQAL